MKGPTPPEQSPPPVPTEPPSSTETNAPSTSRLRAAISPTQPILNGAPASEFLNEVSTRRTTPPSSFAAKKADRETRLAATASPRPKIEQINRPEESVAYPNGASLVVEVPPPTLLSDLLPPLRTVAVTQATASKPSRALFPPHTPNPVPIPPPPPLSTPNATIPSPSTSSISTSSAFESSWGSCATPESRRDLLFVRSLRFQHLTLLTSPHSDSTLPVFRRSSATGSSPTFSLVLSLRLGTALGRETGCRRSGCSRHSRA